MPIKIDFVGSGLTECMLVGGFSCIKKYIYIYSGKRESVRSLHSMEIDEQWEC